MQAKVFKESSFYGCLFMAPRGLLYRLIRTAWKLQASLGLLKLCVHARCGRHVRHSAVDLLKLLVVFQLQNIDGSWLFLVRIICDHLLSQSCLRRFSFPLKSRSNWEDLQTCTLRVVLNTSNTNINHAWVDGSYCSVSSCFGSSQVYSLLSASQGKGM